MLGSRSLFVRSNRDVASVKTKDRHAAVPKRWFKSYFNRWEAPGSSFVLHACELPWGAFVDAMSFNTQCLLNGNAWKYLAKVAKASCSI